MRLHPDDAQDPEVVAVTQMSPSGSGGLSVGTALATRVLWLITISFSLSAFSQVGTVQDQVPYLRGIRFPVVTMASALGVVGLMSAAGKFGFGWLCDRIPPKYACAIGLFF